MALPHHDVTRGFLARRASLLRVSRLEWAPADFLDHPGSRSLRLKRSCDLRIPLFGEPSMKKSAVNRRTFIQTGLGGASAWAALPGLLKTRAAASAGPLDERPLLR